MPGLKLFFVACRSWLGCLRDNAGGSTSPLPRHFIIRVLTQEFYFFYPVEGIVCSCWQTSISLHVFMDEGRIVKVACFFFFYDRVHNGRTIKQRLVFLRRASFRPRDVDDISGDLVSSYFELTLVLKRLKVSRVFGKCEKVFDNVWNFLGNMEIGKQFFCLYRRMYLHSYLLDFYCATD